MRALVALVSLLAFFTPAVAYACGAAYPGGPVMCDYPRARLYEHGEAPRAPRARVSASYAFTSTTILFGGDKRADLTRHAFFGAAEVPVSKTSVVQFGAGGIAGGELVHGAAREEMGPGASAFVGGATRLVEEKERWPFVQLTVVLSATSAITRTDGTNTDGTRAPNARPDTPRFTAFDLRAGVIVGKTLFAGFTPYGVGRAFGGPIDWRYDGGRVRGTDLYKYQLGAGLSLALVDRKLDVFAEGVAFGERGAAMGIGTTFF